MLNVICAIKTVLNPKEIPNAIKQRKQDSSLEPCMSKTGNIVYGIAAVFYVILWVFSIYNLILY